MVQIRDATKAEMSLEFYLNNWNIRSRFLMNAGDGWLGRQARWAIRLLPFKCCTPDLTLERVKKLETALLSEVLKRTMFTFSILQTSIGMQSSAWRVDELIDNKAIDDSYHTSQREMVCKAGKH